MKRISVFTIILSLMLIVHSITHADIDEKGNIVLAAYQFDTVENGKLIIQSEVEDRQKPKTVDGEIVFPHTKEIEAEAEIVEHGKVGKGLKIKNSGYFSDETKKLQIPNEFTIVAWIKMEHKGYQQHDITIEATDEQNNKRIRLALNWTGGGVDVFVSGAVIDLQSEELIYRECRKRSITREMKNENWVFIAWTRTDIDMEFLDTRHDALNQVVTLGSTGKIPPKFYGSEVYKEWHEPEQSGVRIGWLGERPYLHTPNSVAYIDEVAIFGNALDYTDISDIYEKGLTLYLAMNVHSSLKTTTTWGHLKKATR